MNLHTLLQRAATTAYKVPEATLGGIALAFFGLGYVLRGHHATDH